MPDGQVCTIYLGLMRRWNTLKAEEVGLMLQLLPMLLGFFTYKGAVIARGGIDVFAGLAAGQQPVAPRAPAELEGDTAAGQ